MSNVKKNKTKRIALIVAAVVLVLALCATMLAIFKDKLFPSGDSDDQLTYSEQLAAFSNKNIASFERGFTDAKVTDAQSAVEAVSGIGSTIGIDDPAEDLKVVSVNTFDGETFYRMQQYHNDIPVYGKDVVLSANSSGEVTSLSSNTVKIDDKVKSIDADAAKSFNADTLKGIVDSFLEKSKIDIKDFLCISLPEATYYVDVNGKVYTAIVEHITIVDDKNKKYNFKAIIDSDTYKILSCSAETESVARRTFATGKDITDKEQLFTVYEDNGEYVMEDKEKNIKVYNVNGNDLDVQVAIKDGKDNLYTIDNSKLYDKNGTEVFLDDEGLNIIDDRGKVIGTDLKYALILSSSPENNITEAKSASRIWNDSKAVTAYTRVNNVYDLYDKVLDRSGFDGKNGEMLVCYNDNLDGDTTNAYSYTPGEDVSLLTFGVDNESNYDTVGHEFTHSVINSIVELDYNGESGALHEAYADIFGEIAEDYSDGALDNSCNWIESNFRNLIDPSEDGNPTEYKGDNWHTTFSLPDFLKDTPLSIIDLFTDNGGVHSNCTIISHAAYLMNQGIDGNEDYKIDTGLLAKIWYRSMFSLHSDETFKQCANHVYDAATRTSEVTAYQLECVRKAFEMAGLDIESDIPSTIQRGTVVYVTDADGNKRGDYHLTVKNTDNDENVIDVDVKSSNGYILNIKTGTYEMTITDLKGSDKTCEKTVRVDENFDAARSPYININTDF